MDTAEISEIASLCKSEFVNKAYVGSHARGAVRVIWGTEHAIGYAGRGIATGDTVAAGGPCPSHRMAHVAAGGPGPSPRIAHRDVDCPRAECIRPAGRHRHIDNRAGCRRHTVDRWLAVLIENADEPPGILFL